MIVHITFNGKDIELLNTFKNIENLPEKIRLSGLKNGVNMDVNRAFKRELESNGQFNLYDDYIIDLQHPKFLKDKTWSDHVSYLIREWKLKNLLD